MKSVDVCGRWRTWLPAAILLSVALTQVTLTRVADLSPWKGGGFGMFSTTDGWGARHLHAVAQSPSFRMPLEVPAELEEEAERALALPAEDRLRALALALAERAPTDLEPPETVRIDVFARRHDPATLAPYAERLRSVEVRIPAQP